MWSDFVSRSDLPLLDFHEARSLVFSYQTPLEWHVESRTLERGLGSVSTFLCPQDVVAIHPLKNVTHFRVFQYLIKNGDMKYRARNSKSEFWEQKWKF